MDIKLWFSVLCLLLVPKLYAGTTHCIVTELHSEKTVYQEGDGTVRESPCSTFKIPISLMGFDKKILIDAYVPELPFKESYRTESGYMREVWLQPQNPTSWMKNSCVWYSQYITQVLGVEEFERYVNAFVYGNCDLSGDTEKQNGLTRSWLCSSLRISPQEQIEFLQKLLTFTLPVLRDACLKTQQIAYVGDLPGGWQLYGKTGAGLPANREPFCWFVGWVTNGTQMYVFATLRYHDSLDTKSFDPLSAREYTKHVLEKTCLK